MALVAKNPPANAGDRRDVGSIPGLGRSPGEGHGNPLQYSCLENPMDRGAWWATVHGAAELDMTEVTQHERTGLGRCPRIFTSNKLPGAADTANPGTTL